VTSSSARPWYWPDKSSRFGGFLTSKFGGKIRQTTNSHRLLLAAHQKGGSELQKKTIPLVFKAYFENEKDIGDLEVLAAIAEEAGLMSKVEVLPPSYATQFRHHYSCSRTFFFSRL
jgi:2-hydroxychromene-2-carboxylate isomerase